MPARVFLLPPTPLPNMLKRAKSFVPRHLSLAVLIAFAGLGAGAVALTPSEAQAQGEVMSWVPPYQLDRSRQALLHTAGGVTAEQWLTRMGLQFWVPTAKGEVRYVTHESPMDDSLVHWYRTWGRERGVKVLLTIYNHDGKQWNWDTARDAFANHQDDFVRNLVREMDRHQLDGIDLDLEGNGALEQDRAAYARFVSKLSAVLKPRGKLLTIDSFHSPCFNAPNMAWWEDWKGNVDAIHSMGYGDLYEGSTATFTPEGGTPCMQGEQIFKFSWQIRWGRAHGFEPAKILPGIPGGRFEWGQGGKGSTLPAHLDELAELGAGVCIWDIPSTLGGQRDTRWGSAEAWTALKRFRDGPSRSPFWDAAKLSQPTFNVRTQFNVPVRMRDGVKLSVDLYLPEGRGPFPTLIWRTPYSNNSAGEVTQGRWYAQRGYAVVKADVRGKYDSGGEFYHYRDEANDGYDTDEWIGRQPWSNGKIGLMGGSYLGYTEIAQALRGSRFLTAMSASVTTSDIYNNWVFIDGAFFYGFAFPWGAVSMDGHVGQTNNPDDFPAAYRHLPIASADSAASHVNRAYRDWLKHPLRTDPYWKGISFENEVQNIGIPYLTIDGWYDLFLRGALADHVKIRAGGKTKASRDGKKIIIGPWSHSTGVRRINPARPNDPGIDFGPDAELDPQFLYLRWNDYYLKGIDNGVKDDPPVKIFVMGENAWRSENEWPLARTQYTKYYLHSAGRANSLNGDGTLGSTLPTGAPIDTFTYDPELPVPTQGGNTCCSSVPSGPYDQRSVEARGDVLVYTTPVLTEAVEVTGPIVMKLFAASSARDTDWAVKLVDVHPNGYAQNIQDGIIRARYRNGTDKPGVLLEQGRVYEYTIDMWATSNLFRAGHRIRLEVTSSNFPRFDRNLNTGENPATGTRMVKARQTIHHSARYPSHVILPIIPR